MIAKSIIFREFSAGSGKDLGQIMTKINERLILEIGAVDNFITGIILRLKNNNIEYISAGHPGIFVKAEKEVYSPRPLNDQPFGGALLGMNSLIGPYYSTNFTLQPGDFLFLYTDCILENKNGKDEIYGQARLRDSLMKAECPTAKELIDFVLKDFYKFIGTDQLSDDLTIIVLKYIPE